MVIQTFVINSCCNYRVNSEISKWIFLEFLPGYFSKIAILTNVDNQTSHIARKLKLSLKQALGDTRVVAIQGARQTGKSTLARELAAEHNARYLTLDTASVRESARANPADFVRQMPEGMLVIDEIQRVPQLILEIKEVVDISGRPGKFLITGSSDLSTLSEIQESLAGRLERHELMPFSQQELRGTSFSFFDHIFNADFQPHVGAAALTRADYLELAMQGGYPEALLRVTRQRRDAWFDNYLKLLFEQEPTNSKYGSTSEQLNRFLSYLASISGKEAIIDNIGRDMALKRYGVEQLIAFFQRLFLIVAVSAWSTNLTTKAIRHQKLFFKDSGLTARLLRANSSTATSLTSPIAGPVFETFVFNELLRMGSTASRQLGFYHYRDTRQREIDIVVENEDGMVLLIEVKASSTVTASDFNSINYLLEKHPDRIARGIVVYTGGDVLPFGERLLALPAKCLWG
jgi:predicted AAA+ superfamily ATPase